jgi:hypothetical protein
LKKSDNRTRDCHPEAERSEAEGSRTIRWSVGKLYLRDFNDETLMTNAESLTKSDDELGIAGGLLEIRR